MEELSIKPTDSTPEVKYTPDGNIIEFSGSSYPENPVEFYRPIIKWISEYIK